MDFKNNSLVVTIQNHCPKQKQSTENQNLVYTIIE